MAKQTAYNNIAGLNKALRRLPKLAADKLRDASVEIAGDVGADARGRAVRVGGVASLVAPSITATRDRVPVVKMGGSTRLPSANRKRQGNRQTVGDVMWGAEFGGQRRPTTQQFQPFRGSSHGAGYFLWEAVRANSDRTQERYSEALLDALEGI